MVAIEEKLFMEVVIDHVNEYKLRYLLEEDHWICNCKMINRIGLPCPHLMAVVIKYSGDITYYVNSRWLK